VDKPSNSSNDGADDKKVRRSNLIKHYIDNKTSTYQESMKNHQVHSFEDPNEKAK